MKIVKLKKSITRTVQVEGFNGRDAWRKIQASAEMELEEADDADVCYDALSVFLSEQLQKDINKLNKLYGVKKDYNPQI